MKTSAASIFIIIIASFVLLENFMGCSIYAGEFIGRKNGKASTKHQAHVHRAVRATVLSAALLSPVTQRLRLRAFGKSWYKELCPCYHPGSLPSNNFDLSYTFALPSLPGSQRSTFCQAMIPEFREFLSITQQLLLNQNLIPHSAFSRYKNLFVHPSPACTLGGVSTKSIEVWYHGDMTEWPTTIRKIG